MQQGTICVPLTLSLKTDKGQTMNDNHKDIVAAIILGLSLCAGLLAYFDILVKSLDLLYYLLTVNNLLLLIIMFAHLLLNLN